MNLLNRHRGGGFDFDLLQLSCLHTAKCEDFQGSQMTACIYPEDCPAEFETPASRMVAERSCRCAPDRAKTQRPTRAAIDGACMRLR